MKATHQGFCIAFVCGPPGSGKSYTMTRDVVDRLIHSEASVHTNLPLNVDTVAAYVAGKRGCDIEDVRDRIKLIPRSQLVAWQDGHGSPAEIAAAGQSQGNDLVLDECHLFCKKGRGQQKRHEEWEKWLGEARHEGWGRIIFLTQDESKVGQPITAHAELRYELTNGERRRDPLLRIPMTYWYELVASVTREYRASIAVVEYRRVKGKLREQHVERVPLDPAWFPFYRSLEAAGGGAGKGAGGGRVVREYEKRPVVVPGRRVWVEGQPSVLTLPVWAWIVTRFWPRFVLAFGLLWGVGWLTIGGGMQVLLQTWMGRMAAVAGANSSAQDVDDDAGAASGSRSDETTDGGEPQEPDVKRGSAEEVALALSRLSDQDRAMVVAELSAAGESYKELQQRFTQLQSARESERKKVRVVAVTADTAWFTDPPCSCQVGELMPEGPYRGKRVRKIDVGAGWVDLDEGIRLFVGGVADSGVPASEAAGSPGRGATDERGPELAVPQSVPAVGGAAGGGFRGGARGPENLDQRGGDGLRSLLQGDQPTSGSVDSRGRRNRDAAADDANSRSAR